MSLINDALRRAGESSRRRRRLRRAPSLFTALQPVARLNRGGAGLKWVGFFLVLSFGAAVWFLWRAGQPIAEPESGQLFGAAPAAVPLDPTKSVEPEPLPRQSRPVLTEPAQIRVNTNLVVRTSTGPMTVDGSLAKADLAAGRKEVAVASGSFPEIRLQSIIFRSSDPMAMINGQTVLPGDWVDGVLVLEVRRESVVLVWREEEREVRLREL